MCNFEEHLSFGGFITFAFNTGNTLLMCTKSRSCVFKRSSSGASMMENICVRNVACVSAILWVLDEVDMKCYFWGFRSQIWRELFSPLHAFNFGIGGDTTCNIMWRLQNGELKNIRPKVRQTAPPRGRSRVRIPAVSGSASGVKHVPSRLRIAPLRRPRTGSS